MFLKCNVAIWNFFFFCFLTFPLLYGLCVFFKPSRVKKKKNDKKNSVGVETASEAQLREKIFKRDSLFFNNSFSYTQSLLLKLGAQFIFIQKGMIVCFLYYNNSLFLLFSPPYSTPPVRLSLTRLLKGVVNGFYIPSQCRCFRQQLPHVSLYYSLQGVPNSEPLWIERLERVSKIFSHHLCLGGSWKGEKGWEVWIFCKFNGFVNFVEFLKLTKKFKLNLKLTTKVNLTQKSTWTTKVK